MPKGRFIVLEGIDGAGTTTQLARVSSWLAEQGCKVHKTREPSDGPVGSLIRTALSGRLRLSPQAGSGALTPETLALLFAADRLDHINSELTVALDNGFWVLSDRYVASSIAYQGSLVDSKWVECINKWAIVPDLMLYIDIDPNTALSRLQNTRLGRDIYEEKEVLESVVSNYKRYLANYGFPLASIDGTLSVDQVTEKCIKAIRECFPDL